MGNLFYVYDTHGIRFSGALEQLEKERKLHFKRDLKETRELYNEKSVLPDEEHREIQSAINKYQQSRKHEILEPLVYVHQIMTSPVIAVGGETPLLEAWEIIHEHGFRHLPVVSDERRIQAVISDRDILRKINIKAGKPYEDSDYVVQDVIRREAISTGLMTDIRQAAKVMARFHTGAMPVVNEYGRLIGIVTRGDILRGFLENPRISLWG